MIAEEEADYASFCIEFEKGIEHGMEQEKLEIAKKMLKKIIN